MGNPVTNLLFGDGAMVRIPRLYDIQNYLDIFHRKQNKQTYFDLVISGIVYDIRLTG